MNVDNHVFELLPAYALDTLDEDEALHVSVHLVECTTCREALKKYQAVVDQLPLASAEFSPPPRLKQHILQSLHPAKTRENRTAKTGFVASLFARAPLWGTISLVLVLLLGMSNLLLWQRISHVEQSTLRVVSMRGTDFSPQATGMLVISNDGKSGTLVVDNLPSLGKDQQYQLWLIQRDQRTSGGIFSVDEGGYGSLYIDSPQPLGDYSTFGITVEPRGGSPGPTGNKVLGGKL
jgi:anti-sigma-K factor RskA